MNKWLKGLCKTLNKNQLVEIDRRPVSKDNEIGFVVGASEQLLLLHLFSKNMFLDGYSVFPLWEVDRYRVYEGWDFFANRALAIRKQFPKKQPGIDLTDFACLIESANGLFPLITIYRERMDDSSLYIGRISGVTEKTVTLEEISPSANFDKTSRYGLKDITRVDFGGAYESALWLVSCKESGDRKQLAKALALDRPYAMRSR